MATKTELNTIDLVLAQELFAPDYCREKVSVTTAAAIGQVLRLGATAGTAVPISAATPNMVQTLTFGAAATGGSMRLIVPKVDGSTALTDAIAWNATDATWLSNINTALDAATGVAGGIVASGAAPDTVLTFTFSGTGYAATDFPLIEPHTLPTSVTTATVTDATATSQSVTGILLTQNPTVPSDGVALVRGPAIVKAAGLTYFSGATDGQKAAVNAQLLALGIVVR